LEQEKIEVHRYIQSVQLSVQEKISAKLPRSAFPGQHPNFGALAPWSDIRALLDADVDTKLLLLVRHGEALSVLLINPDTARPGRQRRLAAAW
jgi:hypothetical protein